MVLGDKRKDKRDEHQRRHGDFAGRRAGERDQFRFVPAAAHAQHKDKLPCQQGKGEFKFAGRDPYRPALPAAVYQQRGAQ